MNLNHIMIGSEEPSRLVAFYKQLFGDPAMPVFMKGRPAGNAPAAGTTGSGGGSTSPSQAGTF